MHKFSRIALLAVTTILTPPVPAAPSQSVPMPTLVRQVAIPHTLFRLKNGLTVIVHEDHKAPVAAVSVWYKVGSKDAPKGKTGFAPLFQHLLFTGSENLPADFHTHLDKLGATENNGSTSVDRPKYLSPVPSR